MELDHALSPGPSAFGSSSSYIFNSETDSLVGCVMLLFPHLKQQTFNNLIRAFSSCTPYFLSTAYFKMTILAFVKVTCK